MFTEVVSTLSFERITKIMISLPSRLDRINHVTNELKNIQFKGGILLSNGIIDEKPHVGIGKAHMSAMELGMKISNHALIMEDDVQFPGKANTIPFINDCLANAPKEWDILLGGVYNKWGETVYNQYWNKLDAFRCMHFYIVNKMAYERIRNEYQFTQHIDQWISENNFRIYVMNPFCAIQRDDYSDNVKRVTKYNKTHLPKFQILKP